jgi:hypothetical protein
VPSVTQGLLPEAWVGMGEDREIPMRVIKFLRSRVCDVHTTQDLLLMNWNVLLNEERRSLSS